MVLPEGLGVSLGDPEPRPPAVTNGERRPEWGGLLTPCVRASRRQGRLFFRTRGGAEQGWGNVFRMAALAESCRRAGWTDQVFFAEGPAAVIGYLRSRELQVVPLPEGVSLAQEEQALAAQGRAATVFVEMLDVTPGRQRVLRAHGERLVVFDDLCDHVYQADVVVCGQDLPSHANAALSDPRTRFLVGYEWFPARPECAAYADRERSHRAEPRRVLVSLGGGRYDVAYRKAALGLAEFGEALEVSFVLGFDERPDLEEELLRILPRADVIGGVNDLERRMWESDLAIVSAGYTKLEAAITRTPQVMIATQWHQIPLAATFAARTGVRDLGYMSYLAPGAVGEALRELWSARARTASAERARAVVDGQGLERVTRTLFEDR